MSAVWLLALAGGVVVSGCEAQAGSNAQAVVVPLMDDLGTLHRPITTTSPLAQSYFDQGLRLMYAFNYDEALFSFQQAARLDPSCAMCQWGIAFVLGPNINLPMDGADVDPAIVAAREALRLASSVSSEERALIEAIVRRYWYGAQPPLDSAYASAMREVAQRFPNDPDIATLYADAVMNLSPWNYWEADDSPRPGIAEIVDLLERTVAANPDHPGACHLLIHAVEKPMPEKAVPCAERLASLMPGAGHLVHMPGHIYMRVGRYADAVRVSQHATHADARYVADRQPQGMYMLGYVPHNFHFLWWAASMAGQSAVALDAAREVSGKVPLDAVRDLPFLEKFLPTKYLALARFGRWDEILAEPAPAPEFQYTTAMWHYARGLAFAARGDFPAAEAELVSLRQKAPAAAGAPPVLGIAGHVLAGEIAARRGDFPTAIRELESAIRLEDALSYDEPATWHHPVRQMLGAVLLDAGRPADAERVYREDLDDYPNNGWSLFGLAQALRAQGRAAEVDEVDEAQRAAWAEADVVLERSRI